jgi:hypothetical protein
MYPINGSYRVSKNTLFFLSHQMSDVVTALKMSNEGSGAGGGPSSPLDADQTAVDIEAGKDFVILESFILK